MKRLAAITKVIDLLSELLGRLAMYLAIILLGVIVFEVFSRRIFNSPSVWTYETSTMLFGAFVMLIMPYGMLHGVNVSVDLVTQRFSKKTQQVIDLVTYLVLFFPFMLVLLYAGYKFALSSWLVQETSWSNWKPPLYYYKTCIPVAAFFTTLQGVSETLKRVMTLMGYKASPDAEECRHG